MSEEPPRVAGLDLLRSSAIALVLLWHLPWRHLPFPIALLAPFGWVGVDLFFVLSGYLIASQLLAPVAHGRRPEIAVFYLRRALRIFPAYFVVLGLYLFWPRFAEYGPLTHLWRFVTFTHNYHLNMQVYPSFDPAWSLCVEEQFYWILPILVLLLRRRIHARAVLVLLSAIVIAGMACRLLTWWRVMPHHGSRIRVGSVAEIFDIVENHYYEYLYFPTHQRLDGLTLGVGLACLRRFRPAIWDDLTQRRWIMAAVGALCLGIAWWLCAPVWSLGATVFAFPLLAIGFSALLVASVRPTMLLRGWRASIVSLGAALAYPLYLLHKPIIHHARSWYAEFGMRPNSIFEALFCLAVVTAAAGFLHVSVEKPFLWLRDYLLTRKSGRRVGCAVPDKPVLQLAQIALLENVEKSIS